MFSAAASLLQTHVVGLVQTRVDLKEIKLGSSLRQDMLPSWLSLFEQPKSQKLICYLIELNRHHKDTKPDPACLIIRSHHKDSQCDGPFL